MVFFIFIQILIEHMQANSGDPYHMPHSAASGLGLHCVPMSFKKEARLKWVKTLQESILFCCNVCLFVCFVALRPKSTAMVMAGGPVHLTTLFPGQA